MYKRGILTFLALVLLASLYPAIAVDVTLTEVNSTFAVVNISGVSSLYSYEINLDYSGTIYMDDTTAFSGFLSSGTSTSVGHTERDSVLSVYESRLDNSLSGVNGSGQLFNLTHSGDISLRYAFLVYNDSTEEYLYYNSTPVFCGDNNCDNTESCLTCPSDCGSCPVVESPGGGGGGGAPTSNRTASSNLVLSVDELVIPLVINSNKQKIITITNKGTNSEVVRVSQTNLDHLVVYQEPAFNLGPGESKDIKFTFVAPEKEGIYTGTLSIGGKEVYVSLNVQSKELLFDAMIVISDKDKDLSQGANLDTQITLIPMGDKPRVDVTLTYIIKDFSGKVYSSESETILVTDQKNFKKQFSTSGLPTGNYIVGLEVAYPGGVAVSSSHFQVSKKGLLSVKNILIALIVGILILAVVILFALVRYINKRKKLLKITRRK